MPRQLDADEAKNDRTREQLLRRIGHDVPPDRAGPLDWNDIGHLVQGLAMAGRPLRLATAPVTERHGLGPRGAWILNLIAAELVYPHQLADVLQIGRSLISAELARLGEAGLTSTRPGRDRRRTELMLTEAGRAALAETRAELDRIVRAAFAGYSPEDVRLCARMLGDLRNETDPAPS
ncbi:MAG: MarR family winged helix-turn-helix transcriptional regulator [Novosphingobium sp.]